MSAQGGGRRKRHHEEEHENHERWLVTYADMLTVLMALFIVMFALSVVDKKKFEEFKVGLQGDLGTGQSLLSGGTGLRDTDSGMTMDVQAAVAALAEKDAQAQAAELEKADLVKAQAAIQAALADKGLADSVRFRVDERGLVVTVVTDDVLFELGKAELRDGGTRVLDGIAPALLPLANAITVEGHTDSLPISGGRFPSNWELSAERATSVLRYMLAAHSLQPARLSAAGYADQRPVADNTTPVGRSANRRVEVIVRAMAPTSDPALELPLLKPAMTVPTGPSTGTATTVTPTTVTPTTVTPTTTTLPPTRPGSDTTTTTAAAAETRE